MTSSAEERSKRMIHTAGCIIIGDEVLGGKVCMDIYVSRARAQLTMAEHADCGYKLSIPGEVLLLPWHESEADRGHCR